MDTYIQIGDDPKSDLVIEVPSEKNGTLLLSSVTAQYPGATGVRFKSESGFWRGCRIEGNVINSPEDGWGTRVYYVVKPGSKLSGSESELYPRKRKRQSESRPPPEVEVATTPTTAEPQAATTSTTTTAPLATTYTTTAAPLATTYTTTTVPLAPTTPAKAARLPRFPGLTIYMHPPHVLAMNEYGPLMVLFESFQRSNVKFSFDCSKCTSNGLPCEHDQQVGCKCVWKTSLFIEGKLVSFILRNMELRSKKAVAEKALAILRGCQPVHVNSAHETYYTKNEVISGLMLHFKTPRQAANQRKHEWYNVLMDSCQKCGLEVSWWENFGAVFQTKWLVVLLINSKPMSVSWADTLVDAKRAAGISAVNLLKINHPIRYEDDNSASLKSVRLKYPGEEKVADAYDILQRSARIGGGNSFQMREDSIETGEGTGNTNFFSDLWLCKSFIASGKGLSKEEARNNAANQGLQKLMQTLPVIYDKEGPENVHEVKEKQNENKPTQHPNTSVSQERIPGLICYLKTSEKSDIENKIPIILQRSAHRFNSPLRFRQDGTVFSNKLKRDIFKANLYIGEHLFSTGIGVKLKEARSDAFKKAYNRLRYNQPVVYINFYGGETLPCFETSNKELDRETAKEKGSYVIKSKSPMRNKYKDTDEALLLSKIKDSIDTHALIKKYIARYVDD